MPRDFTISFTRRSEQITSARWRCSYLARAIIRRVSRLRPCHLS